MKQKLISIFLALIGVMVGGVNSAWGATETHTGSYVIGATGATAPGAKVSVTSVDGITMYYTDCSDWTTGSANVSVTYSGTTYSFTQYASTSSTNGANSVSSESDAKNGLVFYPDHDGVLIVVAQNAGKDKSVYLKEDGKEIGATLIGTGSGSTAWTSGNAFDTSNAYSGGVKFNVKAGSVYTISLSGSKGRWEGFIYSYTESEGGNEGGNEGGSEEGNKEDTEGVITFGLTRPLNSEDKTMGDPNWNTAGGLITLEEIMGSGVSIDGNSRNYSIDGVTYTTKKSYKKTERLTAFDETQFAGYTFTVPTGKILNITGVDARFSDASNTTWAWKVEVQSADGTTLWKTSDRTVAANSTTKLSIADDAIAQKLGGLAAGTYNAKIYFYQNGTTKCNTIDLVFKGTLEESNVVTHELSFAVSPDNAGSIKSSSTSAAIEEGAEVTLTATPAYGYTFANWTDADGNQVGTNAVYTFNMPEKDAAYTAKFTKLDTYALNTAVSPSGAGTVAKTTNRDSYLPGESVTLAVTANTGYAFQNWQDASGNNIGSNSSIEVTTADATSSYTAVFKKLNSVTFTTGDAEYGISPATQYYDGSGSVKIPANQNLYKEGHTLDHWTDVKTKTDYVIGRSYSLSGDVTLTPVFRQNTVTLQDLTSTVEATWYLGLQNEAPDINYQGKVGYLVTQVSVAGETIDLCLTMDGNNGKWNNARTDQWCQVNNNSKAYLPAVKGSVITLDAYSSLSKTTIDGVSSLTKNGSSNNYSYTYTGSDSQVTVVILDGSYYSYIKATYPAPTAAPVIAAQLGTTSYATITSATDDATIYYTTDGTEPTTESNVYSGRLSFTETATVKALAVSAGLPDSKVTEKVVTILDADLKSVAYLYNSAYSGYVGLSKDPLYQALAAKDTEYNLIPVDFHDQTDATEFKTTVSAYDLLVSTEANGGTETYGVALKDLIGTVPMINLKTFYYGSGRWSLGTASNPSPVNGVIKVSDTSLKLFEGVLFNGSEASLFNETVNNKNLVQTSNVSGATTLATLGGNSAIFTLEGDKPFLSVGYSYDNITEINQNGINIVLNAVDIILAGEDVATATSSKAKITGVEVDGVSLTAKELGLLSSGSYTRKATVLPGEYPVVSADANGGSVTVTQPATAGLTTAVVTLKDGDETVAEYTLNLNIKEREAAVKHAFDFVVGVDGTIDEAFAAANGKASKYFVFIPDGTYKLTGNSEFTTNAEFDSNTHTTSASSWIWNEETGVLTEGTYHASTTYTDNAMTQLRSSNVSIIGQSKENTILYNIPYIPGISYTSTLEIRSGSDNYLQDFTLKNMYAGGRHDKGVAVAFYDRGTRTIAKNINCWSNQDTYVSAATKGYYETSTFAGTVDFLCGGGDIWFQECELIINDRGGNVITAPSTAASEEWGFVFYKNTIRLADGATAARNGNWNLGRPWKNSPASTFLYTTMKTTPATAAWTNMGSGMVIRFHEYGSVNASGAAVDLSGRSISACSPDSGSDNPVLTADEAAEYTVENVFGDYDPRDYTYQCDAPVVSLSGNTLTWEDDPFASCYVIFKDGVYVANTTANSYEVSDNGAYTVRAANGRGGLGEYSAAVDYEAVVLTTTKNMSGYRTFYNASKAYEADENTKVYIATQENEAASTVTLTAVEDKVIPAATPVILKTTTLTDTQDEAAYYQITLTATESEENYLADNLLRVTDGMEDFSANGVYRLAYKKSDDQVGFYTWKSATTDANIVYLPKTNAAGAKLTIIFGDEEEDATAVSEVSAAADEAENAKLYNVAGQQVGNSYKGLVIKNGRKYVK